MPTLRVFKNLALAAAGATILAPTAVFAQDSGLDSGDTAWILTSTALVLLMTLPGLALFYAGLVRAQNVLSVLMHVFVIACLA
jgi:Amt family ammonium transporter